ncbi:hypothetical protein O0I10_012351 [Lichtheimia ornata]|uniref:Uncharacterized protein n=1 Tax=Lichtheimia ornata TaxID=688661 RepID=A0AAD7XVV0_9FUNG|nr:uncharacterized protein O0I10_012351 [Lichtheimia ornata]KAJ8652042.1 hypothetical protein O0I10_012351 [Lichtheimia ornata]
MTQSLILKLMVTAKVDWDRRRTDHMQQHSGQHLLSAVLEQEPFGVEIGSWYMGATRSFTESETRQTEKVTDYAESMFQISKQLTALLSGTPETFVENVARLQHQHESCQAMEGDLAGHVATDLGYELASRDTVEPHCECVEG